MKQMDNKKQQLNSQQEKKETNADLLQWWWQSPLKQYQDYLNLYSKLNSYYYANPNVFNNYDEFKKKFNYDTAKLQNQKLMDYFYNKYQSSKVPNVNYRTAKDNNNSLNLEIF